MLTTELGMKAAKQLAKTYNFYARNDQGNYLGDRLDEEVKKLDEQREAAQAAAAATARRATRRLRNAVLTKTSCLPKFGAQFDSLGKQSSPAMQGGGVEAPMPQTEFAKGTLNNEYYNRLNKKQLAEMQRLQQQQDQNSSNQNQNSQNSTQQSSTSTSLSNSGLMASLSIGSTGVMM